jgi:hypothetical protein
MSDRIYMFIFVKFPRPVVLLKTDICINSKTCSLRSY